MNWATTLVFSYTGYSSQEIVIDGQTEINAALSSGQILEDVVVIGYGTVKREDATGAVQSVTTKQFNQGAIAGPQQLLAGKVAGVYYHHGSKSWWWSVNLNKRTFFFRSI